MRQKGAFSRKLGPNGINVDFEQRTFQMGFTGRLPEDVSYVAVRDAALAMMDELLEDARPHFDRVDPTAPVTPPPSPESADFAYTVVG